MKETIRKRSLPAGWYPDTEYEVLKILKAGKTAALKNQQNLLLSLMQDGISPVKLQLIL